jgi:hypothetical protein
MDEEKVAVKQSDISLWTERKFLQLKFCDVICDASSIP